MASVGGCIGGFTRQGYYFDGGAQSFESLGLLFPLLEKLGHRGAPLAERTDYRLRTPTVDCPLSEGYDAVEAAFCAGHPQSTRACDVSSAVRSACHAPSRAGFGGADAVPLRGL